MKINVIEPSYEILTPITGAELSRIEVAGRTCYKSEAKMTDNSAQRFVAMLIRNKHEAMLEHSFLSVKFICDRGVSHEIVRHRLFSFAQESTRYCNYEKNDEMVFIMPPFAKDGEHFSKADVWTTAMKETASAYEYLIRMGCKPEEARSVLPNSLKTELVVSGNYREWRHFFNLRATKEAGTPHPQMVQITVPLLEDLRTKIPVVFDDIYEKRIK